MADPISKTALLRILRARGESGLQLCADGVWRATPPTRFEWAQTLPSSVWTVPHNLGGFPSVAVVDDDGNMLLSDVQYVDENIIRVTHSRPVTGGVYCT